MKRGVTLTNIVLFTLLLITVGILMFVLGKMQGQQKQLVSNFPTTTPAPLTITPTETVLVTSPTIVSPTLTPLGSIEGTLIYPSDHIPPEMAVCAVNTVTQEKTCTDKQVKDAKFTTGVGYHIDLKPGSYQVYAYLSSGQYYPNYKAYYDEFVTCGLKAGCPSHAPITIIVEAGKLLSKVDPQDWYNNP